VKIDAGSQAKHKITDAQVRGAPTVDDLADTLEAWLVVDATEPDPETGEVVRRPVFLCGYNAARYDVPVVLAEMRRAKRDDVASLIAAAPLLDPYLIRQHAESSMSLLGSMQRYGIGDLGGAEHSADADTAGVLAVLAAQAACGHLTQVDDAIKLSTGKAAPPSGAIDPQGKLRWAGDAPPAGGTPTTDNVVINFGTHKGKTLREAGIGMSRWICGKDFGDVVKSTLKQAWGVSARSW